MSKFGRKPILCGMANISINDNIVSYKGKQASGAYQVPLFFNVTYSDNQLLIVPKSEFTKKKGINAIWGLHRALLNNSIIGANDLFERKIKIDGLGFKVLQQGNNLVFNLGFSHKKEYLLPKQVSIEIDKTGQLLTCKSYDKIILGQVCSDIRSLRPPEPYKGKGICYGNEVIRRKAGKTKS